MSSGQSLSEIFSHRKIHRSRQSFRLLLLLSLCLTSAMAQTNQPRFMPCSFGPVDGETQRGTLIVGVTAQKRSGELLWTVKKYPDSDEELKIADSGLRQELRRIIQTRFKTTPPAVCGIGQNASLSICTLDNTLITEVSAGFNFKLNLPPELDGDPRPADEGQDYTVELCVTYKAPRPIETTAQIEIKTAWGNTAAALPVRERTLAEAAPAGAIPVKLFYAQADIKNMMAGAGIADPAEAENRVIAELLKVANKAFEISRQAGLLDQQGKPQIDRDSPNANGITQRIKLDLSGIYDLSRAPKSGVSWARFDASAQIDTQKSLWTISVKGLQIVRSLHIDVIPDDLDRQYKRTDPLTWKRLSQKRGEEEKELNEKFRGKLFAKPGCIVTTADVRNDSTKSEAEERLANDILSFEGPRSKPYVSPNKIEKVNPLESNLLYCVLRKLPPERAINLKGGFSYAPEEEFLGQVALEEFNNLRFGEKMTLDFARGNQTQKVRFQLTRAFKKWEGQSGFRLRNAGVNVRRFRDNDQRLSNLTAEEIALRETGSSARLSFGYDSFDVSQYLQIDDLRNKDRPRTHWTMLGDVSLDYRDVNIPDSDRLITITGLRRSLLPRARTQASSLALNLKTGVSRDFREPDKAGLGQLSFAIESKLQKGLDLFGADYTFGKALLIARGEMLFGKLTPRDFLLRYTRGVGRSTDKTPVFEMFQLGGLQTVRGIEEGEFIGNRLTYEQTEFGVNALSLWRFIRKPKPKDPNAAEAPKPEKPQEASVDLSNLYLKVFSDRARITDRTSFTQTPGAQTPGGVSTSPIPFLLDRRANGYGVAVELRNLSAGESGQSIHLTIGYARSPQSRLHRSGVMFTGVSFNF